MTKTAALKCMNGIRPTQSAILPNVGDSKKIINYFAESIVEKITITSALASLQAIESLWLIQSIIALSSEYLADVTFITYC